MAALPDSALPHCTNPQHPRGLPTHCAGCGQLKSKWVIQGFNTLPSGELVPWGVCSVACARADIARRKKREKEST